MSPPIRAPNLIPAQGVVAFGKEPDYLRGIVFWNYYPMGSPAPGFQRDGVEIPVAGVPVIYELSRIAGAALLRLERSNAAFHLAARRELHDQSLGDEDLPPGTRVPCVACCSLLDFEDAESPQLDATLRNQCRDDGVEGLLDDFLGLQCGDVRLRRDGSDDVFLGYDSVLRRWSWRPWPVAIVSRLVHRWKDRIESLKRDVWGAANGRIIVLHLQETVR